jgi:DNA-binding transcriptional MerR regulator
MTDRSLADLAARTGVTPRTVRYYIAQGLLPAPVDQGRAARYTDGHEARLRLIKRLQRDHLPLAEIRNRLHALDDAQVQRALTDSEEGAGSEPANPALHYLRRVLEKRPAPAPAPPRTSLAPAPPPGPAAASPFGDRTRRWLAPKRGIAPHSLADGTFERRVPDEFPLPDDPARLRAEPATPTMPPSFPVPGPLPVGRSTWERIALTPDIEIHVRRPLDRHGNRMLDRLLAYARELLHER